jgi:hypothetical protein
MTEIAEVAAQVVQWLESHGIKYALIGGLAVSFRAMERFTKDIDLAIVVENDQQAESIVREICSLGFQIELLLEQQATDRLATVRLVKQPGGSVLVDLLFASSGIEAEIAADAEPIEVFPNVVVRTARLHSLLAMKLLSVDPKTRPQDELDIRNLLQVARLDEIDTAESLVRLISERGYHRGKNLVEDFSRYRARFLGP